MAELLPIKPLTDRGEALERKLDQHWRRNRDAEYLRQSFRDDIRDHTVFMAEHGISYRKDNNIQVGATVVGLLADADYNPNRPLRRTGIILLEGYNNSPYKRAPKDCAELRALRMGDKRVAENLNHGGRLLENPLLAWRSLWITVVSNGSQETIQGINNRVAPTLDPCASPCQSVLENHPSTKTDMPIDTYTYDHNRAITAQNSYTLAQLHVIYENITRPLISSELTE